MAARIVARGNAGDLFEYTVEVKAADARRVGQFGQARQGLAGPQQGAGLFDRGDVPGGGRVVRWAAALARPEARGFGGRRCLKEPRVGAQRPARGAARPAIDAGRSHTVEKLDG